MLKINPEVLSAIKENRPVVALESTIISHGMPYPKNVQTALEVERVIREHGAIPATIGIIDGDAIVGMTPEEIEQFGKRKGIIKVSRRDLPVVYAKKLWAATTVAATMIIANQAGIKLFVTGGIGGVHRGAQETMGVPVLGYKTEELPAFYTAHSGLKVDYKLENAKEAALTMYEKEKNNLQGGILITNPIPEEYSMDKEVIDNAIEKALQMMKEQGIKGKETTPFLLKTIVELTGGDSLESNIKLVLNNAAVGSEIIKEYCKLK